MLSSEKKNNPRVPTDYEDFEIRKKNIVSVSCDL